MDTSPDDSLIAAVGSFIGVIASSAREGPVHLAGITAFQAFPSIILVIAIVSILGI